MLRGEEVGSKKTSSVPPKVLPRVNFNERVSLIGHVTWKVPCGFSTRSIDITSPFFALDSPITEMTLREETEHIWLRKSLH